MTQPEPTLPADAFADDDPDDFRHRIDYLPLDEIVPAESNPKGHDQAAIRRMVSKLGMGELPLIDDRTGRLVAGHGRIEQLAALHAADPKKKPRGVRRLKDGRWAAPVLRGWTSQSDDHANAYLIGSNLTTSKGGWDDHGLYDMLMDLNDVQMLDLAGAEFADLEELEKQLHAGEDRGPVEGDADDESGLLREERTVVIKCPTEAEQQKILETCMGHGWDAAAVTR